MLQKPNKFEKTYYYLILFFAFIMPLSRALVSLFVILLPIIWIYEGDFKRKWQEIKSSKFLLAIILFTFYSSISFFWSENILEALNQIRLFSYFILIFVIATSLQPKYIPQIITSFLMGMFVSEIIAYGVFFELWTFKNATVQNPSPFMIHIDYSVFLAITSILLLNRLISSKYTLNEKILFAFFFCTVTGNLFLATGRTGQVALIAGIIVMTLLHFKLTLKSLVLSLFLIGSIYTTAYTLSNSFKIRTAQAYSNIEGIINMNFNSSWGIRAAFWITTYDILKEHPLGVGIGDFQDETAKIIEKKKYTFLDSSTKEFISTNHPHNEFLLILLQTGIIGLVLFFYMIYQLYQLQIKDKELKELSILFLTIYFVSCMTEPLLVKQFPIAIFVLFVGVFSTDSLRNIDKKGGLSK
ncbi:MAG: hypothetical protein COA99_19890 [Moraxellaceae bacterium]|nr:MAG: hypothetical protein COA99_19890 [Moraxellaceae bacterium]